MQTTERETCRAELRTGVSQSVVGFGFLWAPCVDASAAGVDLLLPVSMAPLMPFIFRAYLHYLECPFYCCH